MYVELKGSSQETKSITLPLEEYQSMLDEIKKLKEDNSMLCRGANVINVLKVDSLLRIIYTSSYPDYYNTIGIVVNCLCRNLNWFDGLSVSCSLFMVADQC